MGLLDGKIAIITGGGRGIGKATALLFGQQGAKVVVADINEEDAKTTANELIKNGTEAIAVKVDVASREEVQHMVQTAIDKWSQIDVLVNNAGIIRDSSLEKLDEKTWEAVLKVNLYGNFYCTQEVIKHMKSRAKANVNPNTPCYGKIVSISSVAGGGGGHGQCNYAASKGGLEAFQRTVAREYARYKIYSNVIRPGVVLTTLTEGMSEDWKKMVLQLIPLGRIGEAKDIANAALFLASSMSDYITGIVLPVDGGMYK